MKKIFNYSAICPSGGSTQGGADTLDECMNKCMETMQFLLNNYPTIRVEIDEICAECSGQGDVWVSLRRGRRACKSCKGKDSVKRITSFVVSCFECGTQGPAVPLTDNPKFDAAEEQAMLLWNKRYWG